ncbi:CocE/NonD family hydrolase [Ferrovibrio sp.]|uniref:CocE/NonD family hydrolase n=1 Tax=Ferrovibrio sp. TaxID=1917215 RepID=UPI0031200F24
MRGFEKRNAWTSLIAKVAVLTFALVGMAGCVGSDARISSPWPGGVWTPGEAVYGSKIDSQLSITMSDGVVLKVDVAYPTELATGARAAGPFPVLLTQTPYKSVRPTAGDYFVQRGYIYVTAYVRGTTTSGGNFEFFSDRDAKDGAELVRWAATQLQGSNSKVGLQGNSYMGLTQIFTLAALGPGSPVKALAPYCMGSEFYRETYFAGGIPTQTLNFQKVIGDSMGGVTAPTGASYVSEVSAGGSRAYDNDWWRQRAVGELSQKVADTGVPVLLWSSDGDIYAQTALEFYANLQNAANKQPVFGPMRRDMKASGKYQIIMSQGGHCRGQDQRITLEWFDTWLKDMKTGIAETEMPIHVHEMVSNRWLNTSHYPVVPTYTRYYLSGDKTLSPTMPAAAGQDAIAWAQPGPGSSLQFDTGSFPNGATLAGPISASFYASTNKANLVLIAHVQVVNAEGTATNLTSGTVLGSLSALDPARSWSDPDGVPVRPYGKHIADEPVPTGAIRKYDFSISPRFVAVPAGSKLRLTVTTQAPTASCPPTLLLGSDPCYPTATQTASLSGGSFTLYYGPANSSSLNLPLLRASCWRTGDNPGIPYWKVDPQVAADAPCQVTMRN